MKNIKKILVAIALMSSLAAWSQSAVEETFKFGKFLGYLNMYYVDSVKTKEVVEDAIVHVLSELDPHSTYIPAEELKRMNEPLEGNFEGIGISFNILNDTLFVISPISGGPSEKVGILSGDRIVNVDGKNIAGVGLTNEDVFSMLRGAKGTKVDLGIKRKRVEEVLNFTVTRDKIPIFSLDASYMINSNTGYIKINRFSATTINEFLEATKDLKAVGAENLILDLTGNGGGYLNASIRLADEFLDDGKLVLYTQGLNSPRSEYLSTSSGNFLKGKVVVLIDEGSASASEIVSGAIQDWDRGIVIGRRSFGKGLVQQQMMLQDESAIRLTIAKYYTPSGRLIQKPYDNGNEAYHLEIYERFTHGEFVTKDSIHFPDSLKYTTLANQRTVYGGGGIMPDIFVPFDTSYYSNYYRDLLRKGSLNQFVLEYVDGKRRKLSKEYPSFSEFNEGFIVGEMLMEDLADYAQNDGIDISEEDQEISKEQLRIILKAFIARDLFGRSEFFEVLNQSDKNVLKAMDVIENWEKYEYLLTD